MATIEQIAPYNTWAVRHQVLYPHMPFETVMLDEDENGVHFGLFDKDKLITVISTFTTGTELQFRKFATLEAFQGKGYGSQMMAHVLGYAREQHLTRIWCNARSSAAGFYRRFGFSETNLRFSRNGIDYVIMEKRI